MSEQNNAVPISSPCVGVCTMNELTGLCYGCLRTIEEIQEWWNLTPTEQLTVMENIEQRNKMLDNF